MDTTFLQCYPSTILVALVFLYYCLSRRRSERSSKGRPTPPEPVGAWPLVGHLRLLMGPQLPHITLGNLADKYGPAFSIRLGVHKVLVVNSAEIAKECLATNDKVFATRPSSVAVKLMGYNYAMFGLGPSGPYWREMRKIAIHQLLSNHRLESLKHIWMSEINSFVKELHQAAVTAENTSQSGGKQSSAAALMEMRQKFSDLTLNIAIRLVAGARSKLDTEDKNRFSKVARQFFQLAGSYMVADAIPYLGWLLDSANEKAMKRIAKDLDSFLSRWLDEHRQNRLVAETKEVEQDFMDLLLNILNDQDMYGFKADDVNKATCLSMVFAGSDTTAVTLTWALSLLLNNRQALEKAVHEIDDQVGTQRQVEESDIGKLVYLQAIVKEAMRLYPAIPLGGPRQALADCTIAGYHIPVGTRLIVNVGKIQRDSKVWSSPMEFQPERFLTTQATVDVRGQHFELLPFGSGRRMCPGISLSLQFIHLILARLLQGFNLETPLNAPIDMTESPGLTTFKALPLQVLVTRRLPSNLY